VNARRDPVPKAPRGALHAFKRDESVPKDWNGTVYCLCGKPGRAGDEQHPDGAPPLVAIEGEPARVLPPTPDEDRSDEIIGEGRPDPYEDVYGPIADIQEAGGL
jgi:hypothetical protein